MHYFSIEKRDVIIASFQFILIFKRGTDTIEEQKKTSPVIKWSHHRPYKEELKPFEHDPEFSDVERQLSHDKISLLTRKTA